MAKAGVIAVFTFALGVMTLWGPCMLLQAFVPATLRPGQALQAPVVGASGASTQGLPYGNLGAATFAMSMVAALATGRLLAARGQRRAIAPVVACRADTRGLPVFQETYEGDKNIDPQVMAVYDVKPEVYEAANAAIAAAGGPFCGGLIGGESAFSSGDYNFDPLGLAAKFPDALPWFREAELKHGRICMLAWVGLVVPDIVRIPGPDLCYKAANVVEAHAKCVGQPGDVFAASPLSQVLMFITMVECCTIIPKSKQGITLANAGDYQLGLNFLPKDEAKAKEMKLKELKNGRLAMMGFGGAITQAVLSGNGFPWLY